MKWIYLIVLLIVGAMVVYGLFFMPAAKGTPMRTAGMFVDAANAGDMVRVRALCTQGCMASGEDLARRIQASGKHRTSFRFRNAQSGRTGKAVTGMFQGRPLTFEMVMKDGDYKIAAIGM